MPTSIQKLVFLPLVFYACLPAAAAEPGSGIAIDREHQVWFTDSSSGVWRISPNGELSMPYKTPSRWLGFDANGRYAQSKPERYQRITGKGVSPALLSSSTGPIAIGPEGDLYYAASNESGPLHILRLTPSGDSFVVAKVPDNPKEQKLRRVNGIAVGNDGAVYLAGNHTIRRVTKEGSVTSVAGPLSTVEGCTKVPGLKKGWRPYMRGIALDSAGSIYVAATGCSSVLKIEPDGKTAPVFQSEAGWTPTGVAVLERDLYVLEYQNAGSTNRREWKARVRRLTPDGKITLLATATPK
jgi:sugar lactone lactonase YvrE